MSAAILDIDCYTIHSWMRSELNLKGNKRDIYAIIYQQSQGGRSYNGSTQALADVVGISKRQVITILSELVNEGLLVKKEHIKNKKANLVGAMESQGTTPRRLTDLIGSLCDLTSGSGDKGTPVVYIQGYFDNYTSN